MGKKANESFDELLEETLNDSRFLNFGSDTPADDEDRDGLWIHSDDEFDDLYGSVDRYERSLRS